jgi:hemimethylated DNA binding protein
MGVDRLPRKDSQPFYNVLVDDGSIRYAADENLVTNHSTIVVKKLQCCKELIL